MKIRFIRTFSVMLSLIVLLTALPLQAAAASGAPPKGYALYLVDLDRLVCYDVGDWLIDPILDGILDSGLRKSREPSNAALVGVLRQADYRNGRNRTRTYEIRPNELKINGQPYILNDEQSKLLTSAYADTKKYAEYAENYPMWTKWFGWNQVTEMEFSLNHKASEYHTAGRYVSTNKALKASPDAWDLVKSMFIYNIQVVPGSFKRETAEIKNKLGDYVKCRMTLKNGTVYTVYLDGSGWVYIESNKQDYGCFYYQANPEIYIKFQIAIAAGEIPAKYIEAAK